MHNNEMEEETVADQDSLKDALEEDDSLKLQK
jgi:hypothetical protein